MKKITLFGLSILCGIGITSVQTTFANNQGYFKEVSCSNYSGYENVQSQDQCFEGGRLYMHNRLILKGLFDDFANRQNSPAFIFERVPKKNIPGAKVEWRSLQGSQWSVPRFYFNADLSWKKLGNFGPMLEVNPYQQVRLLRIEDGNAGLVFRDINDNANRDKPTLHSTYTVHAYGAQNINGKMLPDGKQHFEHREHVFYYGAWCGDGVVDKDFGEEEDNGPSSKKTNCKKAPNPNPGVCDGAGSRFPTYEKPTALCESGTPSAVVDGGDKFTWTCNGVGGKDVSCEVPKKKDAYCGTADGKVFSTAPTSDLCLTGTPTKVTGNGPYEWTCQGVNGGKTMTCGTSVTKSKCDQYFDGNPLRVGSSRIFYDRYMTPPGKTHTLLGFDVKFIESDDMNGDGKLTYGNFRWRPPFQAGSTISSTKGELIIESDPAYFLNFPPKKRKDDNIYIEYTVRSKLNDGKEVSHKECIKYPVTWCGDGVLDTKYGEVCDPNDPTKTAWGKGGCNELCQPTDKPGDKNDLKIKKFAGDKDGQNIGDALQIEPGQDFTYTYKVTTLGTKDQDKVTVTDLFPLGIEVIGFQTIPTGWTCNRGTVQIIGKTYYTVICQTPKMAKNTTVDIVVKTRMMTNLEKLGVSTETLNKGFRNVAYVCSEDVPNLGIDGKIEVCKPDCVDPDNPSCIPPVPPKECSDIPGHLLYDPACVKIPGLDFSIKKYVDSDDAQPGSPVSKQTNDTFNYVIRVKVESGQTIGATTVKDQLPAGVETTGSARGSRWTCNIDSAKLLTCTSNNKIKSGQYFPDIILPAKVTATAGTTIRNDATVYNPKETVKPCHPNNATITGRETSCQVDPKNTDPGVIVIPRVPGTSSEYGTILCIKDVAVIKTFRSRSACEAEWNSVSNPKQKFSQGCLEWDGATHRRFEAERADITKECTPTPPPTPGIYCGDGIVNQIHEQCDPGTGRGPNQYTAASGNGTCSATCKEDSVHTVPGSNPVQYFIKIPTFAKTTRFGQNTLNNGRLEFKNNGMIVGKDSRIFSISDVIELEINPLYEVPIHIEADKKFQMSQNGLQGNPVLTNIPNANNLPWWKQSTAVNAQKYYVIGRGEFLMPSDAKNAGLYDTNSITCSNFENTQYQVCHITTGNLAVPLFKGIQLQEFKGASNPGMGKIYLGTENIDRIVGFSVETVQAKVSSLSSSVNRKIAKFTTDFMNSVNSLTIPKKIDSRNTDTASNGFPFGSGNITPINANINNTGNKTVKKMSDLDAIKHNGNSNIYALKGDLTVSCESGQTTFEMTGVKTVLVEGNITFECNTTYPSNDKNASWAWIAKGSEIRVSNGNNSGKTPVTNLSGVFLAIKENARGGDITYTDDATTTAILRIDGTVYGNAEKLFKSRTYARGTNAYDILTTGTILTYSSRALRNTPPLLSQYLNNYKVQRVVR